MIGSTIMFALTAPWHRQVLTILSSVCQNRVIQGIQTP